MLKFLKWLKWMLVLVLVYLVLRSDQHIPVVYEGSLEIPENSIPKIIHQSWKSYDLPPRFLEWSQTWKDHHPDYEYRLWDDNDNRNLIKEHYPWFLSTYDGFPLKIMRIDSVRVFYLHKFGGIYTDLDIECLKSIDSLLKGHDLVLAKMGDDDDFEHSLPNAWMASKPNHPFWLWCAQRMMNYQQSWWKRDTEHTTGPAMIYYAYKDYIHENGEDSIYIAPRTAIFAYDWSTGHAKEVCNYNRETFSAVECRKRVDPQHEAYAMSYWAHSWEDTKPEITFSFKLFGYRIMI